MQSLEKIRNFAIVFLLLNLGAATQVGAQGTAFTYQGRLSSGTNVTSGRFDFRFLIYDALAGGSQQGAILTNLNVTVSNGIFITALDFGPTIFNGSNRWLEINVRTNGTLPFSILSPRQPFTPTPYAIFAGNVQATSISGVIPQSSLGSGPYNVDRFLRGDGTWGLLTATDTNSISKINGFGTNTSLFQPQTIGLVARAESSNGVAIDVPLNHRLVVGGPNNAANPAVDFGRIMIGVGRDGTNTSGGSIAMPDQGTIYAYPFPNNGGYIRFWGNHGNTHGLLALGGGDISLLPGSGGGLQIGDTGGSVGSDIYMQYRNGPSLADPLGQSHALEFRALKYRGNAISFNSARPGIQGWATVTNESAAFGELRFYAEVPIWNYANATMNPNTPGLEVFRANTNGLVAASGRKFIGDGSGLTNLPLGELTPFGNGAREANTAAASLAINLANSKLFDYTIAPNVAAVTVITTNGTPENGEFKFVKVVLRSGYSAKTLSYPAWANVSVLPTTMPANRMVRFELESYGPGETNRFVVATSGVVPDPTMPADAEAANFLSRSSITNISHVDAIYRLVADIKRAGLWDDIYALYPFVGGDATKHAQNLRAANFNITWNGGLTHNGNGVTGNGSNGWGDTGFNPATHAASANDFGLFVYCGTSNITGFVFGATSGTTDRLSLYGGMSGAAALWGASLNESSLGLSGVASCDNMADHRGPIFAQRTGTSATELHIRSCPKVTNASPSSALPNCSVGILARNWAGFGGDYFSTANLRLAAITKSMSDAKSANFQVLVEAFQARLGRTAP